MARFCNNCGAPLADGVRFCAECGTPVPADLTPEAPAAAAPETMTTPEAPAAEEAPAWQASAVAAPPRPPKEKKPRPKWVLPVVIAVAVIGVGFLAAWQILGHVFGPEKAVENFLEALDAGDAEALAASAVCTDENVTLTVENVAPLLKLYEEDRDFQESVEQMLEADLEKIEDEEELKERALFNLRGEARFLHTAYTVSIGTCSAEITANLTGTAAIEGGAEVQLTPSGEDGEGWAAGRSDLIGPDCDLAHWCTGTARDLLPGLYTVSGSVATSFGDTFTASAELRVTDRSGAAAELNYECQTLEIDNDNGIDAEIYIGGTLYGVVEAHQTYLIAPIRPDTAVEVRADVGTGEPIVLSSTAQDAGGYFTASFALCEMEIYNDYNAPLTVRKGGEVIAEVEPNSSYTVENLPQGTELTVSLYSDILEDVTVVCEETYGYVDPEFTVPEETLQEIYTMAYTYFMTCVDAFNAGSSEAFTDGTITPETGMSSDMLDTLKMMREYTFEDNGFTMTAQVNVLSDLIRSEDAPELWTEDDGLIHVNLRYDLELEMVSHVVYEDPELEPADETDSESLAYSVEVRYAGGAWEIVGATM